MAPGMRKHNYFFLLSSFLFLFACGGAEPGAGDTSSALTKKCAELSECECIQRLDCQPVAEQCYCPYPTCGDQGACLCGGGRYFGWEERPAKQP